jgi:hypothetical protein
METSLVGPETEPVPVWLVRALEALVGSNEQAIAVAKSIFDRVPKGDLEGLSNGDKHEVALRRAQA